MKRTVLMLVINTLLLSFSLEGSEAEDGGDPKLEQLTCSICDDEKDASKFYEDFCSNQHSEKICTKCLKSMIKHNISCPFCRGALTEGAMQASQVYSHLENLMIMIEKGDQKTKHSAIIALEKSLRSQENLKEFEELHHDYISAGLVPALVQFIRVNSYRENQWKATIRNNQKELVAYSIIAFLAHFSDEAKLAISSQGASDLLVSRATVAFFQEQGKIVRSTAKETLETLVIGKESFNRNLVPHYIKELYITPVPNAIEEGCIALAELSKDPDACREVRDLECQQRLLQLAESDSRSIRENATAVFARLLLLTDS